MATNTLVFFAFFALTPPAVATANTCPLSDSETAAAILYAATDATDADTECTIVARDAEVNGETLAFASGVDEAGAIVDLAAEGIIVR